MTHMWMAGVIGEQFEARQQQQQQAQMGLSVAEMRGELRELREQIGKLALMNQALWELLRERLGVTDDDLARRAQEIDVRDGVEDGKMTNTAVRCPKCGRVSNSRHAKCLYCGLQFEKPAMG